MQPQSTEQSPEERPPAARPVPHAPTTALGSTLPSIPTSAADLQGAQQRTLPPPPQLQAHRIRLDQEPLRSVAGHHDQSLYSAQGETWRNNGEWYPPQQQQHSRYYQPQQQQQQQAQSQHHTYPRPPADATSPGTGSHQHHQRPLSGDRAEGVKRLRTEHNHALTSPASSPRQGPESVYGYPAHSAAPLQVRLESVSISPIPASAAQLSRGMPESGLRIAQAPASAARPHSQQAMQSMVGGDRPPNGDQRRQGAALSDDDNDNRGDGVHDAHEGDEADPGSIDPSTSRADHQAHERDSASRLEQKRRLNQACLLCRRKKIRCDSSQPSCSNCQRRGIQCIYPEVRKRGRPPRMYTFADFALPGQPLPPELQGIANVHASAMLPPAAGQAGASMPAWHQIATEYAAGRHRGPGSAAGMSGASTPAHTYSEYDQSPALPPLSVAMGRGGGYHAAGRGSLDPMLLPTPPLGVDQAVLDLFEYITPGLPIVHRQTLVQNIRDRSLTLPLWLAIHAVAARFETHHGGRALGQHPLAPAHHQRHGGPALGAGYAEKTHAMLVNRFGHRLPRPVWGRNERGHMVVGRDAHEHGDAAEADLSRREVIELLQTHVLMSIYYVGNWEPELAVETHAAAVRIAQRMGVHLMDDPSRLPDASGIFNPTAAQHQRKRAQDWSSPACGPSLLSSRWQPNAGPQPPLPGGPNDVEPGSAHVNDSSASADIRKNWIEYETLRRIWWALYTLDRVFNQCAGSPRIVQTSGFRVRLPCDDLEWDSMHAQPTSGSPAAAASSTLPDSGQQPSGLMVRTFREAVMHTSLSEQAANEIAATPSTDPNIYRYTAALAGLIDSVMDFGEDIRALATPPMMEGTEILAQLTAELLRATSGAQHDNLPSTAAWLGSRRASKQFAWTGRSGWHSSSVSAAWPPDWRSRMRVLQERAAELEARFTEWYSSMPIAQHARKPYLYSQLPLQDRITYFHQQIVYYGGVIQLQSLIVMTQGLLLPDPVDDGSAVFGPSALTNMLWRSLMDVDLSQRLAGDIRPRRPTGESVSSDSGLMRSPLPPATHSPYQPQEHSKSPRAANPGMVVDSAAGPGQVIDDATFFMRFNMFTCSAAYAGACIHLQNMKVTPRWESASRLHDEAAAKLNDARAMRGVGVASSSLAGDRDIGALPPPPPQPLPALPCTPDQAREGVKTLAKILEGISPYWRVGGRVDRIRTMWREIEGSELSLSAQALTSPSARIPGPLPIPVPQPPVPGMEAGQWMQRSPVSPRYHRQHRPLSQSPPPPQPPHQHRQQQPPQPSYNNPGMSIAALSSGLSAPPPSMPIHSRQPSAVVGPPPSSATITPLHQHIGMPPPPRP
ncbi:hypothetical protein GGI10_001967 [Coemansia sp. RSA 2530]|nr:hypothetical protein GGI10_001967 [Coemansia sp. RSA 2530]